MLPARLCCVAVSLALHASLYGLATGSSRLPLPRLNARGVAIDTSIAIETADAAADGRAAGAAATASSTSAAPTAGRAPLVRHGERSRSMRVTERKPAAAAREAVPMPDPAPVPIAASSPVGNGDPARAVGWAAGSALAPDLSGSAAPASILEAAMNPGIGERSGASLGVGAAGGSGSTTSGAGRGTSSSPAAGDARSRLLSSYLARVRARVDEHREYPYLARRANLEGTVRLRISIAASGQVLAVKPTSGASLAPLVEAALKSVSSAAPFPPLPPTLGSELTLELPVEFELDSL